MQTKDWIVLGFAVGAAVIAVLASRNAKASSDRAFRMANDAENCREKALLNEGRCERAEARAKASEKMAWQWALICRPKGPDSAEGADAIWKNEFGREPTEPYPEVNLEHVVLGGEAGGP